MYVHSTWWRIYQRLWETKRMDLPPSFFIQKRENQALPKKRNSFFPFFVKNKSWIWFGPLQTKWYVNNSLVFSFKNLKNFSGTSILERSFLRKNPWPSDPITSHYPAVWIVSRNRNQTVSYVRNATCRFATKCALLEKNTLKNAVFFLTSRKRFTLTILPNQTLSIGQLQRWECWKWGKTIPKNMA